MWYPRKNKQEWLWINWWPAVSISSGWKRRSSEPSKKLSKMKILKKKTMLKLKRKKWLWSCRVKKMSYLIFEFCGQPTYKTPLTKINESAKCCHITKNHCKLYGWTHSSYEVYMSWYFSRKGWRLSVLRSGLLLGFFLKIKVIKLRN